MPTFYPAVTQPPSGPAAFGAISEVTSQSQAAVLLALGQQVHGLMKGTPAGVERGPAVMMRSLGGDLKEFPLPTLPDEPPGPRKSMVAETRRRYGSRRGKEPGGDWLRAYAACATDLFGKPSMSRLRQLVELALEHPRGLVRAAAAAVHHAVGADPAGAIDHLVDCVRSKDDLERVLAATALSRIAPDHAALRPLTKMPPRRGKPRRAHTATVVHGTWATGATWWRPRGDFFRYLETLRNDLYSGGDYFRWTGGYSDGARANAAQGLARWVAGKGVAGLDIYAHSHGANAAMLATQLGMRAGKLILLSCPVHWPKYMPDFANVTAVSSVRVKMDLVILADRGGQRFADTRIKETVLPVWFNHVASHDPHVWQNHGVPAKI